MKPAILLHWLCLVLLSPQVARSGEVFLAGGDFGFTAVSVTSLKEARFKSTVRQQFDYSCGSAATATLLTYQYRHPVSEQEIFKFMWDNGDQEKIRREGFSLLDIKLYLETQGYQADGYEAPLEKLDQVGIPAIVLIRDKGYSHFVVVKGLRNGQVLLGDPSIGSRIIPRKDFDRMLLNRILFVIHSDRDKAVFNALQDWNVRQKAPLGNAVNPANLANLTLLRPGPNDF